MSSNNASCAKQGECIKQCDCECYDEDTDVDYDECKCGHRIHNGLCPSNCCEPVKCRNHKYCGELLPQLLANFRDGMCGNCVIQMGPINTRMNLNNVMYVLKKIK
jgi:hypothetical protein